MEKRVYKVKRERQVHKERLERKELLENKVCKGSLVRKEYPVDPLEIQETKEPLDHKERQGLKDKRECKE